jgi:lysophospholipase L1-like esterase
MQLDDKRHSAVIPAPNQEKDCYDWQMRHAAVLAAKDGFEAEIVLIGDSITHFWGGEHPPVESPVRPRGSEAWQRIFGNRKVLNLGFGWDRTQNVLWRLEQGEFDGLKPRDVIIHIGTNNLTGTPNAPENTPAEIADGITAICRRIRALSPDSYLILMAVFPRGWQADDPLRQKIAEINALLAAYAASHDLTFLDIGPQLLEADGSIAPETMSDSVHPTEQGYAVWVEALRQVLR